MIVGTARVHDELNALRSRRGGPVVVRVESLHEEIGLNTRLHASLGGFHRMSPQAGWLSCQFHQFQGFTQLINQAPVDEGIANPALDVKCVRLIVEDLLEVLLQVGEADFVVTLGRMNLRDPLNLPAPLLPIALHEPHWFLGGVGKQSIDAWFFIARCSGPARPSGIPALSDSHISNRENANRRSLGYSPGTGVSH